MRSAHKPRSSIERFLVMVLVGFIAVDLLLIVPAFASELRLDRIHPSLPVVSLRPLADGRARIADELGVELSVPVQQMAGELRKAGAKTFNAILHEANFQSGIGATQTPVPTDPDGNDAGLPLATSPVSTQAENDSGGDNTSTPLPSATPSPSPGATLDPGQPSPTVDLFETSVSQTATALTLPKKTKLPPPTKTPGPSYTPTSNAFPTDQSPTMTPSQAVVVTATAVCASGCLPSPTSTVTSTEPPTLAPSPTQSLTHVPTSTLPPVNTSTPIPIPTYSGPLAAFPGAQGWGAESEGGRGGRIIEVTNLNDSGPGSFRAAVEASGPRIVVFRVAGVLKLKSPIHLTQPFITIAGQTAPGSGIILKNSILEVSTHDVIIRYMTWRGGDNSFIRIRAWDNAYDIIIDHCSASWGEDDTVDIWYGNLDEKYPDIRNITVQNCIIAEPAAAHPTGMMAGSEWTESVDLIDHLHHLSVHHNLFVHNEHRNPRIMGLHSEVINNVVFNWGARIGGTNRASEVDWIGNYFKAGPMTGTGGEAYLRHKGLDTHNWDYVYPAASLYVLGNVAPELGHPDTGADNWWMLKEYSGPNEGDIISEAHRRHKALASAPYPISVQSAYDIYEGVLAAAGANARLDSNGTFISNRDAVDLRLVSEVRAGTGPSSHTEIDVPGSMGSIDAGTPYVDSDHDGMADGWELMHCFDASDPTDNSKDADGDGYSNIEEFLNGTEPGQGGMCG